MTDFDLGRNFEKVAALAKRNANYISHNADASTAAYREFRDFAEGVDDALRLCDKKFRWVGIALMCASVAGLITSWQIDKLEEKNEKLESRIEELEDRILDKNEDEETNDWK